MDTAFYKKDISALAAKFEAQKIAFAPLAFQAVRAMRELHILKAVSEAREKGLSREEPARSAGISLYGAGVLLEIALGLGLVKLARNEKDEANGEPERFILGKTGFFLLEDELTSVNFDFVNDICYKGAFELTESIRKEKPLGLNVFGSWPTIYDALAFLPDAAKKSWFNFDHFYSDIAFPGALAAVFADPRPRRILDIGGNTAKWAVKCCEYDREVHVTVADLPGQTALAEKNAADAGFADRISVYPCNVLDKTSALPQGYDAIWMSQFLDCFALQDITAICTKAASVCSPQTKVFILEPLWDKQRFEAAAFSLQATSLYFTCMANGKSKMYRYRELKEAVEAGGLTLESERHDLGSNCYSLLSFRKKIDG